MPKLLDRVIAEKNWEHWYGFADRSAIPIEALRKHYLPKLKKAIPILADNVAQYYYLDNDQEYWNLNRDFPNLASPFETCWIEHGPIKQINSREYGQFQVGDAVGMSNIGLSTGTLIEAKAIPEGWLLSAAMWCTLTHRKDIILAPPFYTMFRVDHKGHYYGEDPPMSKLLCSSVGNNVTSHYVPKMGTSMHPAFLTFSFMHCKNVALIRQPNPEKLAKRYKERHGEELTVFSTINIEPMKQVLRTEGHSESKGLKVALHICRGHFATYGGESGKGKLFGKHEGTFWIPQHVKGSQEKGTVKPTYKVKI